MTMHYKKCPAGLHHWTPWVQDSDHHEYRVCTQCDAGQQHEITTGHYMSYRVEKEELYA